jgi:hypothetical protein
MSTTHKLMISDVVLLYGISLKEILLNDTVLKGYIKAARQ